MKDLLNFRAKEVLLLLPAVTYFLSYIYLAVYHGEINILNTVIHEGGTYTFLKTLFYATHFIGHIPVHTVLALYFAGVYLCLDSTNVKRVKSSQISGLIIGIIGLIVLGFWISFTWFGTEDTISFLLQKKQSVNRYEEGGSWNLHLTSTMMQFLLIPVYIYGAKWFFKSLIQPSSKGVNLIVVSILFCIFMTWFVNDSPINSVIEIWKDPRYLAHSVRELATFILTYYPVALYFMLKRSDRSKYEKADGNRNLNVVMVAMSVLFTGLFLYQSIYPLMVGIGELAQKPDFAKGGELSILYLLSSHYFEHFLESLFFILLSLSCYYSIHYKKFNKVPSTNYR